MITKGGPQNASHAAVVQSINSCDDEGHVKPKQKTIEMIFDMADHDFRWTFINSHGLQSSGKSRCRLE